MAYEIIYLFNRKMKKRLDSKIKELEKEKSELDITFLQSKKQEYQERIRNILDDQTDLENENAREKLNELRLYHKRIKDIDYKISHNDKVLDHIKKKIDKYKGEKEKIENLQLYRETSEWITELLGEDTLYQYAKETKNEELIKKFESRKLTYEEYLKYTNEMYRKIFPPESKKKKGITEQPTKPKISLPEWMEERIKEILKDNKEFTIEEIEKFLKKILKKLKWEINISHIKTKFWDRADKAIDIVKEIIADYPEFEITENTEKKTNKETESKKSKNEKLIATINTSPQHWKEASKNHLLNKLTIIWEETNLWKRIDSYIEILERLWQKFSNKQAFKDETAESIKTQTSIQIEEWIIRALKKLIEWMLILRKSEAYWYRSFELGEKYDNWRILLYPNREIMKICSHPEYESIIDSRPPADKR